MKDWLLHAGWNPLYPVVLADEGLLNYLKDRPAHTRQNHHFIQMTLADEG